jgi:serine/threonine protein kinase
MQRFVALKVSADQGMEPQTLAQLEHEHIVRVYDQKILAQRRMRLMYMQHIAGGTLNSVVETVRRTPPAERRGQMLFEAIDRALEKAGKEPPSESWARRRLSTAPWPNVVCWLGARLAAALDYAHRRDVLHRDIKPANVLLNEEGSPKLADFNISYSSHVQGLTPAAYFGGSLPYMSTEQLQACHPGHDRAPEDLDGRSDTYSLGIMLWELLTGKRPFEDAPGDGNWTDTLEKMLWRRHDGVPAEAIALLPPDCPPGLKDVLLKCSVLQSRGPLRDRRRSGAGAGALPPPPRTGTVEAQADVRAELVAALGRIDPDRSRAASQRRLQRHQHPLQLDQQRAR